MRLKLKQWKGRFALFLALCMIMLLTGCGREASGAGKSGTETPESKAVVGESAEAGKAGTETTETKTVGGSAQKDEPDDLRTEQSASIDEEGSYTTAEDVSLYLHTYEKLPNNFITKKEANALGWSGGSLEPYAPGKCIGGDKFGNYEGILPDGSYHECDIDTLGAKSRGAKRLVYSEDGRIYYTEDHYTTFTMLYD